MAATFLVLAIVFLLIIGIAILMIASQWKLFTMAGKPGWAAIVPVYNMVIMLEIAEKPIWWLLLMFVVPIIGIIWYIKTLYAFAQKFGKDAGFTAGLFLLPVIFWPLLAFSSSTQYKGYTPGVDTLDGNFTANSN